MVSDTNSLSMSIVKTTLKFYQGHIDGPFCGAGPFCSLKDVSINAFSESPDSMLAVDGYMMNVIMARFISVKQVDQCEKG